MEHARRSVLEEEKAVRQCRANFAIFIVGWLGLADIFLCALIGSTIDNRSSRGWAFFGYALFIFFNLMFGYFCYCRWTDPTYKHLREALRRRRQIHAVDEAKDRERSAGALSPPHG
jgi:hypothetical protein